MNQQEAQDRAEEVRQMVENPFAWSIETGEFQGDWFWHLRSGSMFLHEDELGGWFFATISHEPDVSQRFTEWTKEGTFAEPDDAVQFALKNVREFLEKATQALRDAEAALPSKKFVDPYHPYKE